MDLISNVVDPVVARACNIDSVLRVLFSKLKNKDLCQVMLVCCKWKDVAETLWDCHSLDVNAKNLHILRFKRNRRVKCIHLREGINWSFELLRCLSTLDHVEVLMWNTGYDGFKNKVFDQDQVPSIEDSLISSAFANLRSLEILNDAPVIRSTQLGKMLSCISKNKKLESLSIRWMDCYEDVPEMFIIEVMKNLDSFYLSCNVNYIHGYDTKYPFLKKAMTLLASGEIKLTTLELDNVDTSSVDSEIIASALINIETLIISDVRGFYSLKLYKKMTEQKTCIKEMSLTYEELDDVPHQILANAFNRVQSLNLTDCELTEMQAKYFFEKMAQSSILKELFLQYVYIDTVNPLTLAKALTNLESLHLVCDEACNITTEQAVQFFIMMQNKESKLMSLTIMSHNDFSNVEAQVLAKGINSLEKADLDDVSLSIVYREAILREACKKTNLTSLRMNGVGLDIDLVEQTKEFIKNIKLCKKIAT